jgi:hypothetical protein
MNEPTPNLFPLTCAVLGFCLLVTGVWFIYRPASLVLAGLLLLVLAVFGRPIGGR